MRDEKAKVILITYGNGKKIVVIINKCLVVKSIDIRIHLHKNQHITRLGNVIIGKRLAQSLIFIIRRIIVHTLKEIRIILRRIVRTCFGRQKIIYARVTRGIFHKILRQLASQKKSRLRERITHNITLGHESEIDRKSVV